VGCAPQCHGADRRRDEKTWGRGGMMPTVAPSHSDEETMRSWLTRCQRLGRGPAEASAAYRGSSRMAGRKMCPFRIQSTTARLGLGSACSGRLDMDV
jgi:hypothetical protein